MVDLLTCPWLEALRRGEVDASGVIMRTDSLDSIRPLDNRERRAQWAQKWAMAGGDPAPSHFNFGVDQK